MKTFSESLGEQNARYNEQFLRRQIDEARSKAMEWRPIKTAPKDGTCIIVWDGLDAQESQYISEPDDMGRSGWCYSEFSGGGMMPVLNNVFPEDQQPTHWMPLPDPPKGS